MWNFFGDTCEKIREIQENIIEENGYHWEKYTVTTEDGYINTIYRIPYSHNMKTNNNERRPPVILGHGLNCCSAVFVNQCKLGYYLAEEGYDVWLPNNRGTTFSRKHVILDSEKDKDKYWDFGWHEIGVYDIPAFVDFVIERTGFEKVFYIGHSQGTTAFAVFLSERPEYNDKIRLSCFMGSVIFMDGGVNANFVTFVRCIMTPLIELVDRHLFRIHTIPFSYMFRAFSSLFGWNSIGRYISMKCLYCLTGYENFEQATELDLVKFGQTMPNSSSVRALQHFMQIIQRRSFTKYDYGPQKNLEKYGSIEPPCYDLAKVTSPVALFYGKNDMYNDYKSDNLDKKLGNVVKTHVVEDNGFNHIDFLIAKDSIPLVYSHLVEMMKQYQKS